MKYNNNNINPGDVKKRWNFFDENQNKLFYICTVTFINCEKGCSKCDSRKYLQLKRLCI